MPKSQLLPDCVLKLKSYWISCVRILMRPLQARYAYLRKMTEIDKLIEADETNCENQKHEDLAAFVIVLSNHFIRSVSHALGAETE